MSRHGGRRLLEPVLADDALLADIAASRSAGGLRIWWLGQSGYLVQWQGRHALLDPYLSDSLTEKYSTTDLPHVRMTRRPVAPERLDFVDLVTASHHHTDHMDPQSLTPIMRANPSATFVAPVAHRHLASSRAGLAPEALVGVDDGDEVAHAGFCLHAMASAHEALERDEAGHCKYLGFVLRCGPWTLYHSGDTLVYPGLVERLRPWSVDVALLPINGRAAGGRVAANMDGEEAAALAQASGVGLAVPCHYEMFTFNTVPPEAFVRAAQRLGQPYRVLRGGERLDLPAALAPPAWV